MDIHKPAEKRERSVNEGPRDTDVAADSDPRKLVGKREGRVKTTPCTYTCPFAKGKGYHKPMDLRSTWERRVSYRFGPPQAHSGRRECKPRIGARARPRKREGRGLTQAYEPTQAHGKES